MKIRRTVSKTEIYRLNMKLVLRMYTVHLQSLSNICSTKLFVIKLKFFYTHIVIENYDCRYKGSMDSTKGCLDTLGMCLAFD